MKSAERNDSGELDLLSTHEKWEAHQSHHSSSCGPTSLHLTAQEMFQSQREAALRRRKLQFQSGFVGSNTRWNERSMPGQPDKIRNFEQRGDAHSMHAGGQQHHSVPEADHKSLPESVPFGAMHSRTVYSLGSQRNLDGTPVITELTSSFPTTTRQQEPAAISSRDQEYHSAQMAGGMASTPKKSSCNFIDRFDEQTTISELTEHQNSDDRLKVGRLTRSPSTLSRMVSCDKLDTRPLTTLESTSEGDPTYQCSTIEDNTLEKKDSNLSGLAEKESKNANCTLKQIDWNDVDQVKKLLMDPVPKETGMIKCYIKRNKKQSRFYPEYRLYLSDGDMFLLSSKKRKKKKSSNYLISMSRKDLNKGSEKIIGKLRSNFLGTEYQIYDTGKNPKTVDPFFDEKNGDPIRRELGIVLYGNSMTSTRGPRRMNVCIAKIQDDGEPKKDWQPENEDESMLKCFKHKTESALRDLYFYENRQPKWNEDMSSYVLNFNSRVTMASVKNFQLIDQTSREKEVMMQFGRNGDDEFIMDVQWPMSIFQAFAISLSSCDSKIACD